MKLIIGLMLLLCAAVPVQATYYEIITNIYTPAETLQTGDSLYMTDGGFDMLSLFGESFAIIENTSTLIEGSGGIWEFDLASDSHLDFSGGELKNLDIGNNATAILSGGSILSIESKQTAIFEHEGQTYYQPHITIDCFDHFYNDTTNLLTGHWNDVGNTAFSIELHDVSGYDSAIDNIQFIPEPMTLSLLGLGAVLIRKRH